MITAIIIYILIGLLFSLALRMLFDEPIELWVWAFGILAWPIIVTALIWVALGDLGKIKL